MILLPFSCTLLFGGMQGIVELFLSLHDEETLLPLLPGWCFTVFFYFQERIDRITQSFFVFVSRKELM